MTAEIGSTQERVAAPSTWTVQAPHCATPQPYFVPVLGLCRREAKKESRKADQTAHENSWPRSMEAAYPRLGPDVDAIDPARCALFRR